MGQIKRWMELRNSSGDWSSKWKTFNDDQHLDNYLEMMYSKGYKVELYKKKPW